MHKDIFIELERNRNIEVVLENRPELTENVKAVMMDDLPIGTKEHNIELLLLNRKRRKLIEFSEELASKVYSREKIDIQEYQSKLTKLDDTVAKESESFYDLCLSYIENIDVKPDFLRTNFKDLDRFLYIERSDLIMLAARPSMGKTAFQLQLGLNFAFLNYKVLAFSLEMKNGQLAQRLIANIAGITLDKIRNKNISDEDKQKLTSRLETHIKKLHLDISDRNYSFSAIKKIVMKQKQEKGIDVVMIDFLQLIATNTKKSKNDAIGEVSRKLKEMAKELDVVIILLSQLSRKVDERLDKRPILSDLRDSGEIEANADTAMFLYCDDYYNKDSEEKNIMQVIVRKQRQGQLGAAYLYFEKETQKIKDLAR
jgi:replicative DNA helicase